MSERRSIPKTAPCEVTLTGNKKATTSHRTRHAMTAEHNQRTTVSCYAEIESGDDSVALLGPGQRFPSGVGGVQCSFSDLEFQFALAVAGAVPVKWCKTCGRAIDISDDGSQADKDYCDEPCRLKAYRDRKKKAWRMKDSGDKLSEIAKALETTVGTVRVWVK